MKTTTILACIILAATLSGCGNFEWFPDYLDTTIPTVTATIAGNQIFANRTTHVAVLPSSVTFFASEPATIFYTTNGNTPDTSSPSVGISTGSGATGPSITITNTILKFFGRDESLNSSAVQTSAIKSP